MASNRACGKSGWGRGKARPDALVTAAAVAVHRPRTKDLAQVHLAEQNQKVQTLAALAAE